MGHCVYDLYPQVSTTHYDDPLAVLEALLTGHAIECPGHDVAFSSPRDFDVELVEILSTQSLMELTAPSTVTPTSNELRDRSSAVVDLTSSTTSMETFGDIVLPQFDVVSCQLDEEGRCLQADLHVTQSTLHQRDYLA